MNDKYFFGYVFIDIYYVLTILLVIRNIMIINLFSNDK